MLSSGVENEQCLTWYLLVVTCLRSADDNVVMWLRDVLLLPRLLVKVVN